MAETGAITAYLKDIAVLEDEAERRMKAIYGEDCDVRAHRTEFLKFRKDILHEIISRSKYGRKNNKKFQITLDNICTVCYNVRVKR